MTEAATVYPVIVKRWMEAWNSKSPEAMGNLFTNDGIYEDAAFKVRAQGQRGVARWITLSVDHIPDLRGEVEDAFESDHRAAIRWTISGTPKKLGAVQGTGKSYRITVLTFMELQGDRLARVTDCYNLADLLQQLGLPHSSFPLTGPWRAVQ